MSKILSFSNYRDDRDVKVCTSGSPFVTVFEEIVDDHGVRKLVKSKDRNLYDIIQSCKNMCNMELILKNLDRSDPSALIIKPATFFDALGMPSSLQECYSLRDRAKRLFDQMPVEVRSEYNNNFESFVSQVPDFFSKLAAASKSSVKKSSDDKKNEEVK